MVSASWRILTYMAALACPGTVGTRWPETEAGRNRRHHFGRENGMLPTNAYEKLYFRFSLLHTLQLQLNSSLYQQFYLLSNPVWHCQINPSLTSTSVLFPRNKNSPKVLIPTKTCPIFQTGKDAFKQLFHANYHTLIQVVISTSEIDTVVATKIEVIFLF